MVPQSVSVSADPETLFMQAQARFAAGDAAGALTLLDRFPAVIAEEPLVLHLRALALKKAGRLDEAQAAFERAQAAAPFDPEILNNRANLLLQVGEAEAALPLYAEALRLKPGYREARFNRMVALQAVGRLTEALALADAMIADNGGARVHAVRGAILLALERHADAADAFERAIGPAGAATALPGRARVALERGEASAADWYRRAHAAAPGDRDILIGLADALEAEGDPGGIALLRARVAAAPDWVAGHERLARMRAEAGEADFADHYQAALNEAGDQQALRLSLARVLAGADHHAEAVAALAPLPENPALAATRAFYLGEAGDPAAGLALLDGREDAESLVIAGRLALATGELDKAVMLLGRAVALEPGRITAWAHCELAWRAVGDPRAAWLSGQAGLISTRAIGLPDGALGEVAAMLRGLHRTRAFPVGQSLRGGTQTRGRLFLRREPEIARLHAALTAAVADHVAALPPADPRHPLLKHRGATMGIAGSWSVRLTASGFHVHHIHSEGLMSSACYIALPDGIAGSATRDGWLEIGLPPASLNLALEPIATIEPAPGRLALFPSYLYHGTRPFAEGERLTVAFDIVPR